MNWLKHHLNIQLAIYLIIGALFSSTGGTIASQGTGWGWIFVVIGTAIILAGAGWVLKRKNKSLIYLSLIFVPLGWIVWFGFKDGRDVIATNDKGEAVKVRLDRYGKIPPGYH